MFGNSYTALVIQINGEDSGQQIWKDIDEIPIVREVERTRIWYSDLAFIVLQGNSAIIEQTKTALIDLFNRKYSVLLARSMLRLVVCPSIAKNTFTKGRVCDEMVETVECMRLALVFHGYADLLPFLTMLNPPQASPLQTTQPSLPRPSIYARPSMPARPPPQERAVPVQRPIDCVNPVQRPMASVAPMVPRPPQGVPIPPRPIQYNPPRPSIPRNGYLAKPLPPRPSFVHEGVYPRR